MNLRQAAQQALEALIMMRDKYDEYACPACDHADAAITALRAALAEPDSDYERGFVDGMNLQTKGGVGKTVNRMAEPEQEPDGISWLKRDSGYFTAPTPRQWVGLTDEEIDVGLCRSPYALQTAQAWRDGVEWAQEQLKEKNT